MYFKRVRREMYTISMFSETVCATGVRMYASVRLSGRAILHLFRIGLDIYYTDQVRVTCERKPVYLLVSRGLCQSYVLRPRTAWPVTNTPRRKQLRSFTLFFEQTLLLLFRYCRMRNSLEPDTRANSLYDTSLASNYTSHCPRVTI